MSDYFFDADDAPWLYYGADDHFISAQPSWADWSGYGCLVDDMGGCEMKVDDLFPPLYFSGSGKLPDCSITIKGIFRVTVRPNGSSESRWCLAFEESDLLLLMNRRIALDIAQFLGDETDAWIGERVELFSFTYPNKKVGVRVRCPSASSPASSPASSSVSSRIDSATFGKAASAAVSRGILTWDGINELLRASGNDFSVALARLDLIVRDAAGEDDSWCDGDGGEEDGGENA